jgi:hypothetical protein
LGGCRACGPQKPLPAPRHSAPAELHAHAQLGRQEISVPRRPLPMPMPSRSAESSCGSRLACPSCCVSEARAPCPWCASSGRGAADPWWAVDWPAKTLAPGNRARWVGTWEKKMVLREHTSFFPFVFGAERTLFFFFALHGPTYGIGFIQRKWI